MTMHPRERGPIRPADVLIALLCLAAIAVVFAAVFLRALDYELDQQGPPVTPNQETHTP